MKNILPLVLILVFCISCDNLTDSDGPSAADLSINESILQMPDMRISLPDSLSGSNTTRAEGDTSLLDITTVDAVKSESWIELNNKFNSENPLEANNVALLFIDEIKQYAEEMKDQSINLKNDTIYHLGVRDLMDQYDEVEVLYENMYKFDLGSIYLKEEGDHLSIYWSVRWPENDWDENDEMIVTGYMPMRFFFDIDNSSSQKVTFMMKVSGSDMCYYSYYDEAANLNETYSLSDDQSIWMSRSREDESALTLYEYDKYMDDGDAEIRETIAFGDSEKGGIVYVNDYGSSINAGSDFFDETGNMVLREYGNGNSNGLPYWTEYAESEGTELRELNNALTEAPESFKIRRDYNNSPADYSYSFDNGSSWTACNESEAENWVFYWKSGTEWATGDCSYWWNSSEFESNVYTVTYSKGDVIKDPVTYFGSSYRVYKQYPLNSLLPLAGSYADEYDLKSLEGAARTYDWDDDGEMDYSYTPYGFYLVDKGETLDTEKHFMIDGLALEDYWYWDYSTLEGSRIKAYTYSTGSNLPAYFNFSGQNIVDSVTAKINGLYDTDYSNWRQTDYLSRFSSFPGDSFYNNLED